jgi:hypothetical protein
MRLDICQSERQRPAGFFAKRFTLPRLFLGDEILQLACESFVASWLRGDAESTGQARNIFWRRE